MLGKFNSRPSSRSVEKGSNSQASSSSLSSRRTSSRLATPLSDNSASHRHQPYPSLSRRASNAQISSSSHSSTAHLSQGSDLPHASQAHPSPIIPVVEGGPVGGSVYGQINLLADLAAREAEEVTGGRGRDRGVPGWRGPASRSSSSHRAYGPPVRGWSEIEGERSEVKPTPRSQSSHYAGGMNTLIRTRHPLSGLTLDKEYPPYVSGQFEADVKRVLLTPTLTSRPRPPLTPSTSGTLRASTSSAPAPPPQWPPHLVQTHGRAEPEHGRAWTYSLGPDPARPPPPPLTPGVNLSLPPPRLGYNAKFGSPTTSGSPSSHAPSPRPSTKTPSARTRSYVDHMASFAGFTSDAPRPIRYWNVTAPATPQPSQSSVASRPAIRDTIRIKPNSRSHPDVSSPNIDSSPLSASLSLSSIASAPLPTRDQPEAPSPSRSLPEIQGQFDRGRASVTDNGWTNRPISRKTSRVRKGFCEIKTKHRLDSCQLELSAAQVEIQKLREENDALRRGDAPL